MFYSTFTDGQISQNFMVYSYNYLKAATQGFKASNKIGEGGFGSVYKVNFFNFLLYIILS